MRAYRVVFFGEVKNKTYRHGRRCGICRNRFVRGAGSKRNRTAWRKEIVKTEDR